MLKGFCSVFSPHNVFSRYINKRIKNTMSIKQCLNLSIWPLKVFNSLNWIQVPLGKLWGNTHQSNRTPRESLCCPTCGCLNIKQAECRLWSAGWSNCLIKTPSVEKREGPRPSQTNSTGSALNEGQSTLLLMAIKACGPLWDTQWPSRWDFVQTHAGNSYRPHGKEKKKSLGEGEQEDLGSQWKEGGRWGEAPCGVKG